MSERRTAVLVAIVTLLVSAAPAAAHNVSPNYLSRITQVSPGTKGISLTVINRADQLQLTNRSGRQVIVEGYNNDPYARVAPDGTVSVNTNSPAYYLNEDYFGNSPVPKGVTGKGAPKWKVLDKTGRFQWHDHRIHWMSRSRPPQVKNPDVKTQIFNWQVPLEVAGTRGKVAGTLYWVPKPGTPKGFIIVGSILLVAMCLGAVVIRRRRSATEADGGTPAEKAEAW